MSPGQGHEDAPEARHPAYGRVVLRADEGDVMALFLQGARDSEEMHNAAARAVDVLRQNV